MQLRAIAMARWVLPVPVPPASTTLRCCAMKPPLARSRTSASREVVEHRGQIEPAPADDLEVGKVGLPKLVGCCRLVRELEAKHGREQMQRISREALLVILALLGASTRCWAWGDEGHM